MCEASRKVVCVLLGSLPAWVARHRHLFHDIACFERWSVNGAEFFELTSELTIDLSIGDTGAACYRLVQYKYQVST